MSKPIEIGKRYGKLVIISEGERHICPSGKSRRIATCQCDCGEITNVFLEKLNSKRTTKSCGCFKSEKLRAEKTKHGLSRHPLYKRLGGMRRRCYDPKFNHYHRYGGRGIKICDEWLNDFKTFYDWAMANGWEEGLEIDRKDNDGNYEPSNCRFITHTKNSRNKSTTRLTNEIILDIRNTKLLTPGIKNTELAKAFGIQQSTVSMILSNKIWREEQ